MQIPSVDQVNASIHAARAKGHAEYAGRCLERVAAHRNALMEARRRDGTATATCRASAHASCRIAHEAYGATRCIGFAEHDAANARREAKTPAARKLAEEANKSVTWAARVALEVAERACATCAEAVEHAEDAERAYYTEGN